MSDVANNELFSMEGIIRLCQPDGTRPFSYPLHNPAESAKQLRAESRV
jgi:hypothetical protein